MTEAPKGDIFVYGTLRDPDVLRIVLDGVQPQMTPARLTGHAAQHLDGEVYPILTKAEADVAEGILLGRLTERDHARLWFFEAEFGYHLAEVTVDTEAGPRPARVFFPDAVPAEPLTPWTLDGWRAADKPLFLEMAAEFMEHFDGHRPGDAGRIYSGVHRRAISRLRARDTQVPAQLRQVFPADAVTIEDRGRLYSGFFALQQLRYRHRRFDGGEQESITREVFVAGDAVSVLPWDPVTDTVLVIEQLRAGPLGRADPVPWLLEPIAGVCDRVESAEDAARREAREEAGLDLGEMVQVAEYYTSPGSVAEYMISFVARADLSQAGGHHGLAHEGEDIRALVVPLDTALAAVDSGEIRTGPLALSLLALARRKADLLARPGFRG